MTARIRTHYVGCWQKHHECALCKIKELQDAGMAVVDEFVGAEDGE